MSAPACVINIGNDVIVAPTCVFVTWQVEELNAYARKSTKIPPKATKYIVELLNQEWHNAIRHESLWNLKLKY